MKNLSALFIIVIVLFSSCQKEIPNYAHVADPGPDTTTDNSIPGEWNFISITVKAIASVDADFFGINQKTVTYSNYTTTNNTGLIIIGDTTMSSTNVGYDIAFNAKSYQYQNNILLDSLEFPITSSYSGLNSSAKYELIGTDSIYYPEGSFATIPVQGVPEDIKTGPSGEKYVLDGNNLTFISNIYRDTIIDNFGTQSHLVEVGTASMLLQRK